MTPTRRDFLSATAAASGLLGSILKTGLAQAGPAPGRPGPRKVLHAPNGAVDQGRRVGRVRVFHLVAEPVTWEVAPGLVLDVWGYNGRTPGPVLEMTRGERVRIYVTNHLPESTSVHWHGMIVPNGMDGVAGLTQRPIPPGATWRYEFVVPDAGTFMYHPHFDEMTQMAMGMMGMIVVREPNEPRPDRDYCYMINEWSVKPGTRKPDPGAMSDFNVLTLNGKVFPGTEPMVAAVGERVRVRFGNLGAMDHHAIHFHGLSLQVTATDGGPVPLSARQPETTTLVPVGTVRVVEMVPSEPGDWPVHCHMTHHVMTQMGHGLPNLLGVDPGGTEAGLQRHLPEFMAMGHTGMGGMGEMNMAVPENSLPMKGAAGPFSYIDMGGMFTVLAVRARLEGDAPLGWYQHPEGSVARPATHEELAADGVAVISQAP